jgi:hypothetical protein
MWYMAGDLEHTFIKSGSEHRKWSMISSGRGCTLSIVLLIKFNCYVTMHYKKRGIKELKAL